MIYDKNDVIRELATLLAVPESRISYDADWSKHLDEVTKDVTDGQALFDGIYDMVCPDNHEGPGLKKDFPTALDAAHRLKWVLDWQDNPEDFNFCGVDYLFMGLGKCRNRAWISFLAELITDHGE